MASIYTLSGDLNEDIKKIISESQASDLSSDEQEQLMFYMETGRHISEIVRLFKVFRFNMENLRNTFYLTTSDELVRNEKIKLGVTSSGEVIDSDESNSEIDDEIAINALTINFLSSCRTLLESIEVFIDNSFSENFPQPEDLTRAALTSRAYDENFHYRLLVAMRNYSQHGNLPVSVVNGKCFFDFPKILNTPHFEHNAERRKQMEGIVNEIITETSNYPNIAFTATIAEGNLCATEVYVDFLRKVKATCEESDKNVRKLMEKHPNKVFQSPEHGFSLFTFILNDETSHSVAIEDTPAVIDSYLSEAEKILREEKAKVDELRKAFQPIKS